uniref:Uncharacterized protein n=1 Tax=Physcomitrium patens TaxID=3218 RepID=A0A2K1JY92_PHYPA|nr:hypothetical protein PHYPA_013616 [Physcomitrium patens]
MANSLEDEYQALYLEHAGFDRFMSSFIEKINIVRIRTTFPRSPISKFTHRNPFLLSALGDVYPRS